MISKESKIYIAGHRGMVGSAIARALQKQAYSNVIGKTSKELDLRDQAAVLAFIEQERPEVVIDAAARVGGIMANQSYPYAFLMENLQMQNNLIDASIKLDVQKFIFLGSSCIYPKQADQPLKEEYLLTGPLEPTNEWYAIAKIAGVKACEAVRRHYGKDFVSLMPTNLYGPFDNFDLQTSHVMPAMVRKFHEATMNGHTPVTLWGSGKPYREFLHVDDLAHAVLFAIENILPEHLYNVGYGSDLRIAELAALIQTITGHQGEIIWDASKPDGTLKKLMDSNKLRSLGWEPQMALEDGISATYQWFLKHQQDYKEVHF